MREVCRDVQTEPTLLPINENDYERKVSSDSVTRVNNSTRVTIFGDSDSTRVTLRNMVTRLVSSHVFYIITRLESQSMTRDSSQSHFCKISEPLIDKPSLFACKEMIIFWSSNDQNWCKFCVLTFKSCYAVS